MFRSAFVWAVSLAFLIMVAYITSGNIYKSYEIVFGQIVIESINRVGL